MNKELRETLIALLDDENGISGDAYAKLQALAIGLQLGETADIFRAVEASCGRYYLPEDHGIIA